MQWLAKHVPNSGAYCSAGLGVQMLPSRQAIKADKYTKNQL